ncbi:hypothetical protein [Rhodococcus koreensis]|jgi:MFS family permease|uniref:hypothetical protein n=1 Tax=Rhodococcus koreensis TaxID=99653 RepID=UPI0009334674|nr:hypothetical protein [Rhodococcus koreensis]
MVGLIAALVVAGRLADRFGRKAVLIPGLAAAVIAAVTAGMAAGVDLAPDRHKRTGSLIASVSMVFGAGLGPLLAGGLAASDSSSPQTLVFTVVLFVEVAALIVATMLPMKRSFSPGTARLLALPSAAGEPPRATPHRAAESITEGELRS